MAQHSKKIVNELCNYLGYELDGCMCQELHNYVQEHPELQIYIDSVKTTVNVCKEAYKEESLPEDLKKDILSKIKKRCQTPKND